MTREEIIGKQLANKVAMLEYENTLLFAEKVELQEKLSQYENQNQDNNKE